MADFHSKLSGRPALSGDDNNTWNGSFVSELTQSLHRRERGELIGSHQKRCARATTWPSVVARGRAWTRANKLPAKSISCIGQRQVRFEFSCSGALFATRQPGRRFASFEACTVPLRPLYSPRFGRSDRRMRKAIVSAPSRAHVRLVVSLKLPPGRRIRHIFGYV
jgi:hypothetical protein